MFAATRSCAPPRAAACATLVVALLLGSRPAVAERVDAPSPWTFDVGLGYGESWAAGSTGPAAHTPFVRLRGTRLVGAGLFLAVDVIGPMVPAPWGQVSAGLGLGRRFRLGELQSLDGGNEAETQLVTVVGAGYAYAVSGLGEGYLASSDDATSYYGPYGRVEAGLLWVLHPDPDRTRLGAVSIGAVAGVSAMRAVYRVPEIPAGWRFALEGILVADLRW
jgi:hypothetical protein